jgi:hypothetical protein
MATLYASQIQQHERALGGWQAEWETLPELITLVGRTGHRIALMRHRRRAAAPFRYRLAHLRHFGLHQQRLLEAGAWFAGVCGTLGKFANDFSLLMQTEVAEVGIALAVPRGIRQRQTKILRQRLANRRPFLF